MMRALYGYCSPECRTAAEIQALNFGGNDYNFITDRLAIGNVVSRATPGFVAVVSVLATDRPGTPACEVTGAPTVPSRCEVLDGDLVDVTQHIHIDLADGECHSMGQPRDRNGQQVPSRGLEDYLDETIRFIAAHIRRGCVLVHCGAGKSRSVAVVIAYLCRYAGMSLTEALTFVSARRPGACPAPCFIEAIKRWLRLDELAMGGPRR
jgi:hypothetical protein